MKQYLSYFKLRFIVGLQYRAAAIAGICTQFFFGFVFIMVYLAFYESNVNSAPMELSQLISYVWLGQAFFSLTNLYHREKEIVQMIKNGDVAYELCRPGNLYLKWFSKIYATKISSVILKFLPVIVIGIILPEPYNLIAPTSLESFIGFILTLLAGSVLICTIITLLHVLIFYTIDADGILNAFRVIAELFAGSIVPVPLLPKILQVISKYLPFQYMNDIPFRIYVGNIGTNQIYSTLLIQVIWIIIIVFFSIMLTKKSLKKVVVQGG